MVVAGAQDRAGPGSAAGARDHGHLPAADFRRLADRESPGSPSARCATARGQPLPCFDGAWTAQVGSRTGRCIALRVRGSAITTQRVRRAARSRAVRRGRRGEEDGRARTRADAALGSTRPRRSGRTLASRTRAARCWRETRRSTSRARVDPLARMLAGYVSGHGYGHATRVGEVLREVRRREPSLPIAVVTSGPGRPVPARGAGADRGPHRGLRRGPRAEKRARDRRSGHRRRVAAVPGRVRRPRRPRGALAARGAARASCSATSRRWPLTPQPRPVSRRSRSPTSPGTGSTATSPPASPRSHEAADRAAAAYARCGLLLELPFAGDLAAFPRRVRIPLVARRPRVARDEARRRLKLDGTVVLISFGGLGLPGFDPAVLARMPGVHVPGQRRRRAAPRQRAAGRDGGDGGAPGSTTSTSSAPPTSWSPSPGTGSCRTRSRRGRG